MSSGKRATFLGTGTSTGVPVIGCRCSVCQTTDARNSRLRSSLWLEIDDLSLVIDAGPDLRQQALRTNITKVDGVIYTHGHLDHVTGFDELRAFCWHRELPLPLYASAGCLQILQTMFAWAFAPTNIYASYVKPEPIVVDAPFQIGSLQITPLPVIHGSVDTHGYRFDADVMKTFAYLPDVKCIPESTFPLLYGCDILIIDALRAKPHPTHLSIAEAVEIIERLAVKQSYLTHCSHEINHAELQKSLPSGVNIAYDQLILEL